MYLVLIIDAQADDDIRSPGSQLYIIHRPDLNSRHSNYRFVLKTIGIAGLEVNPVRAGQQGGPFAELNQQACQEQQPNDHEQPYFPFQT
jgi:hypothetical protein